MRIEATGTYVIVEPQKETRKGVIEIPNEDEKMSSFGIVTSVGPDVTTIDEFDIVLFGKYAGQHIKLKDEKETLAIKEEDILGVIEK